MSVFRSAPIGAVCLLYAAMLGAAPVSHPSPPIGPLPTALASSPLQEAVHRIWQASPEVQAARADLDAAQARARAAAQPLYNPSLSLDAENADVNRRTAGISLPLDLSGKRRARASQGKADLRAAEATYNLLRRDVAARWLKAWSTAALAARQSELGRRRLALMQRFDDLAAQRLKVGDISSPERDLAGLALGEAQVQQATLAGNEAAARAALLVISGDQPTTLPPLPIGLSPAAGSVTPLPVDELPELRQSRAQQASAEAGVQVARRARIPDPTLSLTGGQVRGAAHRSGDRLECFHSLAGTQHRPCRSGCRPRGSRCSRRFRAFASVCAACQPAGNADPLCRLAACRRGVPRWPGRRVRGSHRVAGKALARR